MVEELAALAEGLVAVAEGLAVVAAAAAEGLAAVTVAEAEELAVTAAMGMEAMATAAAAVMVASFCQYVRKTVPDGAAVAEAAAAALPPLPSAIAATDSRAVAAMQASLAADCDRTYPRVWAASATTGAAGRVRWVSPFNH